MAITCPVDLDTRRLRDEIQSIYARVADDPSGAFHFHRGPEYAVDLLRYDREALSALPDQSTASFAGVANPHRLGPIGEGLVVADIGCGAGMDLLLAAKAVGPRGRAIGVDMTEAMAEKARAAARAAGLENVEVRIGDARESKQGALGEGRLHSHRREHARERSGARQEARTHEGPQGPGSRMRRRND